MNLPDFICVGAQKAGTTSFFDMIKYHPDVSMSTVKELHYFDIDENYSQGAGWYSKFFNKRKDTIIGECTPDYMLYNYIPSRIRETLGDNVKFIFILRNPIERAYSQFNFQIMKGVEYRSNFVEVMNMEKTDQENNIYNEWFDPAYYLSRGLYYNQIERYLNFFNIENMHFVLFEDLFGQNQKTCFNEILFFLGLDEFDLDKINFENKSMSMIPKKGMSDITLKVLRKNKGVINIIKAILPKKIFLLLREQILSKTEKRPQPLNPDLKARLNNEFFREDILRLEGLINKDLSKWLN